MASEWLQLPLGDVMTLQRGFDLPSQDRKPGKVPIVSSSGVSDYHSEVGVKGPGVVTGRYGTIGQVFLIKEDYWPLNTTLWVKDFHGNDPHFASYLLRTIDFRSCSDKSSVPGVNRNDLHRIPVLLPPLPEQKAIAAVLGALDDKIELNRRMNATLESMARALFQSWFVDFDPVRAKIDGRKPEGLDKATAALFPESFHDSVLGQIPKGWEISTLGSILDVLETGRRPKGGVSSYISGIPSIGAESINGIGVFDYSKTKFIPPEFFEKTLSGRIAHFDVLLYKDGGKPGEFKPRVGMYGHEFPFKTFCINEHVFRMRSTRTGQSFLYFTVSDQRVLSDFANKGGKAAIPGINQPDVKSTPIVLPSKGITDAFNARADILCDQILCNAKQSRTLATLRDALLPKLLSGDLSVDKIKEGIVA
jgi:type I restriction enzyme S subunit